MGEFKPATQAALGTTPYAFESSARDKIYTAALTCFQARGVRKTTMAHIAREAGMSRPAIYYYFEDKQALIVEAVIRQQAESQRVIRARLAGRLHGMEAIIEASAMAIERALANIYSTLLTRPENERLTAAAMHSPAAREVQAAFWGPLLADSRARGELRTDLSDAELIHWILFIELSVVTNGPLMGLNHIDEIRQALRRFLSPALAPNADRGNQHG